MSFQFTKMQGLGNDFVVIDTVNQAISITPDFIRLIADRHYGVGCDQVLLITPTQYPQADFGYRIYNADGGEAYQCGNGARCVGLFIHQKKMSDKKIICLETKRDLIRVQCLENNNVQADIAKPVFDPTQLPFKTTENALPFHLSLSQHNIVFDVVSVGNPHCVINVDDIALADLKEIGEQLNQHAAFPEGVNVSFMRCESRNQIQLAVYERGAGLTQACGSAACAAMAVGRRRGYLDEDVAVVQAGGTLHVTWPSNDAVIQLCGPASAVFEGVWL